ncbi:MAG: FtsH protease activity modulator HflK [Verrucomicrobiota bacterium]|nr:FtsH protease activity modulator HflK [Verrucomicrobiota bacterium]
MKTYDFPPFFRSGLLPVAIVGLLLLILLWTGIYTIPVESVGVVQRLGKYYATVEPGLRFKIPYGIDRVTIVPVRRQLKMEFGFATRGATDEYQVSEEPDDEKLMVTGDLNTALVEWIVQYRVSNPRQFLFAVRNPKTTLRDAAESIMREVVGDRTVDEVITIGRQDMESECLSNLQTLVNRYEMGLGIDQVQLKNVNPPRQVQASFDEVNQAQQEKQRAINVANGEYNKAVPRARGNAERLLSEATGYATKRVNEATGDVARFQTIFAQYQRAPEVTKQRLYLETMVEVIPKLGRKIILDQGGQQALPLLQLQTATP